jgi:hypothetical protein
LRERLLERVDGGAVVPLLQVGLSLADKEIPCAIRRVVPAPAAPGPLGRLVHRTPSLEIGSGTHPAHGPPAVNTRRYGRNVEVGEPGSSDATSASNEP